MFPTRDESLNYSYVLPRTAPDAFTIPVLLLCYYPLDEHGHIDIRVTGDVGGPLDKIREHVRNTTWQVKRALEVGSIYHGYKDRNAEASLRYEIIYTLEFHEPLPVSKKPLGDVYLTDYVAIMQRVNIEQWVMERGIKEVWLWGYHGGVIGLWESNMAGPWGDISNSDRDLYDLPVLANTYTVYHYNYQRGPYEATEDHMHQIERLLYHADADLFWKRFVGGVREGRCGWAHYPPNGLRDYDWANPDYVVTDIEDWTPDGTGTHQRMNCNRWRCDSLTWFIYWMQNIPGANNGITYNGHRLTNWWTFVGDFDNALARGLKLVR